MDASTGVLMHPSPLARDEKLPPEQQIAQRADYANTPQQEVPKLQKEIHRLDGRMDEAQAGTSELGGDNEWIPSPHLQRGKARTNIHWHPENSSATKKTTKKRRSPRRRLGAASTRPALRAPTAASSVRAATRPAPPARARCCGRR